MSVTPGANNATVLSTAISGSTSQTIFVADIISEGPIEGLVNGEASVYLNNIPLAETSDSTVIPTYNNSITFSGGTTGTLAETLIKVINPGIEANRFMYLYGYQEVTDVNVIHVGGQGDTFEISKSGVDFSNFLTYEDDTLFARLVGPNRKITGQVTLVDGVPRFVSGMFIFSAASLTGSGYTLVIDKAFTVTGAPTASTITVAETPIAGTYDFAIGPLLAYVPSDPTAKQDIQKVGNTSLQFKYGNEVQQPIVDVGGVGSSPAIPAAPPGKILRQCAPTDLPADLAGLLLATNEYPVGDQADGVPVELPSGSGGFELTASQIAEVDEVRIPISYPSLISVNTETGTKRRTMAVYDISIKTSYRGVESGHKQLFNGLVTHTDEKASPVAFEHIIQLDDYRPFDGFIIRVTRLSRDRGRAVWEGERAGEIAKNAGKHYESTSTSAITSVFSVIKEKFIYPFTAYAAITFSSESYSSVPQRTYDCYGLKVRIPNTYTTRERSPTEIAQYSGFWDGSFREAPEYTDNPAWIFYDIITNNRYGVGEWIKEHDINKFALYRIARYCDELIDDGKEGVEPRFRANVYLTKAADVYKVLKDMATIFTGMLYHLEGQVTAIIDAPADPVYSFSKGNVLDGQFSYESTGTKTRINQVIVTWNNPANNYEQQALIVEDPTAILRDNKIISEEAFAFGTTSEGQATRYGRWKLFTAQNQTELVSFSTALQGAFLQPGDIINIQDADRYGISLSGRLKSGSTTTTVNLDRSITLRSGFVYQLSVLVTDPAAYCAQETAVIAGQTYTRGERITGILTEETASNTYDSDGDLVAITWKPYTHIQTKQVSTTSGAASVLSVSSAFSTAPGVNTIWALKEFTATGEQTVHSSRLYRILTIGEDSKNIYGVTAVEHFNEKYAAVDEDYALGTIPDLIYPGELSTDAEIPSPQNLYILTVSDFRKPQEELEVIWQAPDFDFIANYEIVHNISGIDSPILVGRDTFRYKFNRVPDGAYNIKIRTVSTKGNTSRWSVVTITVNDPFGENVPRSAGGIAQGAVANVTAFIDAGNFYRFEKENYALAPVQTPFDPFVNSSSDATSYSQDISGISDTVIDNTDQVTRLLSSYFLYFDRNNADRLKLIGWDVFTFNNLYYWYDAGNGSQNPTFYNLSGTVTIAQGSNNVVGTGTSFTSELNLGDVVQVATGIGGIVVGIPSDTLIILDRSFSQAHTNITLKTTTLQIDFETDCIIARVYWDGTNYYYDNYLTLNPDLDQLARYVNVDSNIQFINYSAEETQETTYTDITLNITAFGFTTPEFKVTGLGFAEVTGTEDLDYQAATSPNTYIRLINDATAVSYNAGAVLDFLVEVREGNDPTNTNKQRSTTFRIGKVIGGSIGQDAKTVQLTASDYSIVYDQDGLTPSFEGTGGNITLTATAQGFVNPVYKFTGDGIVDDTVYGASNTKNFTVPASFFNSPQVLRVSVAESGVGTEEAFDNISIFAVKPGSDAYTVILTNEAHTLPANDSGVVTSFAGSGSLIEVFKGGTQLQFITSGTPTLGQFSVLVSSNTGMSAPSITVSGLNASIADFTSMVDDTEIVTYTINAENISTNIQKVQSFSKSKAGVEGADGVDAITTFYDNQAHTVPVTNTGVETWTGSGGTLNVFDGTTELILDSNSQLTTYPTTNGRYRLNITKVSGDTLTEPTITGAGTVGATLGVFDGNLTTATQYLVDIYVKALDGTEYNPKFKISLSPSFEGAEGAEGAPGATGLDGAYSGMLTFYKSGADAPTSTDIIDKGLAVPNIEVGTYAVVYDSTQEGQKFFMVGSGSDQVRTYNVTTPFDLSTASHANINLSVGTEEGTPTSLYFSPEGTKLFIIGPTDDQIYSYTLTTPWNVSTASYDNIFLSIGGDTLTNPQGLSFNPEGTKLFVIDLENGVYYWKLTTPYLISSASFVTNIAIPQDALKRDIFINSSGTRMFIAGDSDNRVYSYTLSTPWDIITTTYDDISFLISGQEGSITAAQLNSTGTRMFITGTGTDRVYSYTLSTAFNLSTALFDDKSLLVSEQDDAPQGLFIIPQIEGSIAKGYRAAANDGTTVTWTPAEIVVSEIIAANAITANQLQISSNEPGASRMFFNGGSNRIEIYDSTGALRVALGDLTDL